MTTQPTNNPVPSESPRDLKFNAGKIDEFVTSLSQQYIDRFGQAHYTIEGLRQIAQRAIAEFGWITMDSFQEGAELTLPNQVLRDEVTGEYYRWDGDFPKVVPAGSTPETAGGVETGAWISVGDATLRLMLASSAGAAAIGTSSGNTVQQELSMSRIVANVRDPQFAGGAKGDWNETTQSGTDDTAAFQAAINYLASLPDRREGGARVLYVPEGMYMTKGIIVPNEFHFGFNMIGAGRDATLIYCNPSSPATTPGLFIKSELSYIDNLSMFGSSISRKIDTTNYVTDLIRVQLDTNRGDCDLVCGGGVQLGNAMNCVTLYGRGFIFKGVGVLFTNFLNIVASSSLVWDSSNPINSITTGMRNYMINGCRFDQGLALVTVSGDGAAATTINGLRLIGNDVLGVASIISADTATLFGLMINSNTMYDSGNVDVIRALNVVACTINANVISKKIAIESAPAGVNDCLPRIVRAGNNIIGLNISNNEFGPIRDTVVSSVNAASRVKIIGNTFHQAFALAGGAIFSGVNCSGLKIAYNDFTGTLGGTLLMWSPTLQTSIATAAHNISNAGNLQQSRNYSPTVNKGGTPVTPTASACYYDYDGSYCTARYALAIPCSGVGGVINVSVPMQPLADFANVTSTISGGGVISWMVGGSYAAIARVLQTGFVNFMVSSTATAMAGTDVPTTLQIEFEVKYRA